MRKYKNRRQRKTNGKPVHEILYVRKCRRFKLKKKGYSNPCTSLLQAYRVSGVWGSQTSRQSAHEGRKVVSLTRRPPLPAQEIFLVHTSVRGWFEARDRGAAGGMSIKNSNDTIRIRTCDLPACIAMSQPTMLPDNQFSSLFCVSELSPRNLKSASCKQRECNILFRHCRFSFYTGVTFCSFFHDYVLYIYIHTHTHICIIPTLNLSIWKIVYYPRLNFNCHSGCSITMQD
jgi:hypothetical protein